MKKKTFKTQADLFSYVLDEFVNDEETCISEFCLKNKAQAYENLKAKRNHLAEEWNRLTEEREKQIGADAIEEFTEKFLDELEYILHQKDLKLELNQALSIYARFMNRCNDVAEQLKERGK